MDGIQLKRTIRGQESLEAQILQEMAEALGNSGERVERALARLQESLSRIRQLRESSAGESQAVGDIHIRASLEQEVKLYNRLRHEALEQYRWLIIHREALGIRNHTLVAEQYRIPPPIKA